MSYQTNEKQNHQMRDQNWKLPILAPKSKLLNVRLVHFHSFKTLISRVGIPKNQPGEEAKMLQVYVSLRNKGNGREKCPGHTQVLL